MFKKYHSSSYAIIIALVVVLLSPVLGCAQSEGNKLTSKKSGVNIPGQNVVLNPAIKGSQAVLKKKDAEINTVKKELSTAKTELVKARMARVQKGKKIFLYGASTKGNTMLQYYKINNKLIPLAAEKSPEKWNKYTIGTGVKIISEKEARKLNPDYFLVTPWGFIKEFVKREYTWLKKGGKFILPFPNFKLVK